MACSGVYTWGNGGIGGNVVLAVGNWVWGWHSGVCTWGSLLDDVVVFGLMRVMVAGVVVRGIMGIMVSLDANEVHSAGIARHFSAPV